MKKIHGSEPNIGEKIAKMGLGVNRIQVPMRSPVTKGGLFLRGKSNGMAMDAVSLATLGKTRGLRDSPDMVRVSRAVTYQIGSVLFASATFDGSSENVLPGSKAAFS